MISLRLGHGVVPLDPHVSRSCPPLLAQGTFVCASAILVEAILFFLGIGIPPEMPTSGNIMTEGRALFRLFPQQHPVSGPFLAITMLAVNILGDGLRDTLDPRLRKQTDPRPRAPGKDLTETPPILSIGGHLCHAISKQAIDCEPAVQGGISVRSHCVSSSCVMRRAASWAGRLAVGALLVSLIGAQEARAQDLARGKQVYQLCGTCHGDAGDGKQMYHAPSIAGLQRWYVEAQLKKFKEGMRAYRAEDVEGLQMRPMARALVKDEDLKAVAAYVASMKPVQPPGTLKGDPGRGKVSYGTCLACHGEKASGNEQLAAPSLAHQADWYLVSQINKFRAGLRGTHPKDLTGAQMRPMAMTMTDEQSILDLVAYIRSLTR